MTYLLIMLVWVLIAGVGVVISHDKPIHSNQKKAEYLYRFAKFVEWPQDVLTDTDEVITICIIGKKSILKTFESLGGKKVRGKKLVINQITAIEDFGYSHILFICFTEQQQVEEILRKVQHKSVLTVGEMEGFAESGGIINLVETNKQFYFEINTSAARTANLKVSSKLLNIARVVRGKDTLVRNR